MRRMSQAKARLRRKRMFSDYDLHQEMEDRKRRIAQEIDSLKPDYILNANVENLCTYFEEKYRYEIPVLKMDQVCFEQEEVDVDISQDFNRAFFDRSEPYYIK